MEVFWNKIKYRIVPVICLVMAVLVSQDVFSEYNNIRYGFILAGVLSIFIGAHGNILKGIAVLEILISFAVIFQKTNQAENLIEAKKISRLQSTLVSVETCSYRNDWAQRDCAIRNEPKIAHNKVVNEKIANLKLSVSTIKVLEADPSLLAFIIFSCALPWLSFLSAKKIEIEKEIIYQDRFIEVEKEKIDSEIQQKDERQKIVNRIFAGMSNSAIQRELGTDRRKIAQIKNEIAQWKSNARPESVQLSKKVVDIREVKKGA